MNRTSNRPPSPSLHRPGTILIVTIWIMLTLTGLVLVLAQAMRVEAICSANNASSQQAWAIEQGATQYVLARTDNLQGLVPTESDMPCEAIRLGDGAFWIIKPVSEDERTVAYGVVDEASKLNINASAVTSGMLLLLPGMTEELAACIVDWRDSDSTVSPNGAEDEYYSMLKDPYRCKSSPFETVDELLLVKGASRDILYGEDTNRNGVLDANENDAELSEPLDNRDGQLDRGLTPFVTVYSAEPAATAAQNIFNVNSASTRSLRRFLETNLSPDRAAQVRALVESSRPLGSVLDFFARSGLTVAELDPIIAQLAGSTGGPITSGAGGTGPRGLINVITAPQEVLACLPGLDESDVAALINTRTGVGVDTTNVAWVAQALPREKLRAIGGLITVRSYQFSADIVSVAGDGRAFRRCRVIVDASSSPPRVIFRQDLTGLGWPLAPEIVDGLRAGQSLDEVAPVQLFRQELPH